MTVGNRKKNRKVLERTVIGLGVWLPIIAVVQVYSIVAGWLATPARGIVHILFLSHFFERISIFLALQQFLGVLLAFATIIAILFLTGSFVMTWMGKKMRYLVETYLLGFLPLYNFFKGIVVLFASENGEDSFLSRFDQVGFVHVLGNETFALALVTSRDPRHPSITTSFLSSTPNFIAGRIYNVPTAWVHMTTIPVHEAMKTITVGGVGMEGLIAHYVAERIVHCDDSAKQCFLGEKCPLAFEVLHAREIS